MTDTTPANTTEALLLRVASTNQLGPSKCAHGCASGTTGGRRT